MGVDIHPAGHHDQIRRVNDLGGPFAGFYDLAVLNADLLDGPVDSVGRIVYVAAHDFEGGPHHPQSLPLTAGLGAPLPPFFIAETFAMIRSRTSRSDGYGESTTFFMTRGMWSIL